VAIPVAVIKLAWKFLGPIVTTLVLKLGDEAIQAIRMMIKTKQSERRVEAEARAEKASRLARLASAPGEAQRYEAQAKVWREVAEQYAQDNRALSEELEQLKKKFDARGRESVQALGHAPGTSHPSIAAPGKQGEKKIDDNK